MHDCDIKAAMTCQNKYMLLKQEQLIITKVSITHKVT